jgi:hypothetical protein
MVTSRALEGLFQAKILVRRNVRVRGSASYCTRVALNADLVASPEPKFTRHGFDMAADGGCNDMALYR